MRENKFSALFTEWVTTRNVHVFNVTGSMWQKAGYPDLYLHGTQLKNNSCWVELKSGRQARPTPLQLRRIWELNESGIDAYWLQLQVLKDKRFTYLLGTARKCGNTFHAVELLQAEGLDVIWCVLKGELHAKDM